MPRSSDRLRSMSLDDISEEGRLLLSFIQSEFEKIDSKIDQKFDVIERRFLELDAVKQTVADLRS